MIILYHKIEILAIKNTGLNMRVFTQSDVPKIHEILLFLYENSDSKPSYSTEAEIIKNYIDSNISDEISIDKLSGLIFKSPSQTIRIFKKQLGITPYEYHMKNRIEKAISLLHETNKPVKEIAFNLGFCDEHYFSNIFKKKTGKTPTEYRKDLK